MQLLRQELLVCIFKSPRLVALFNSMHTDEMPLYNLNKVVHAFVIHIDGFSISYHMRMVHTIHVYAYGTTVRVWYGYLYHMRMANIYHYCYKQHIVIASTVLLFTLNHELYPWCNFLQ